MTAAQKPQLLTSAEVADLCRVSRKTVTVWVKTGKVDAIRLPGGALRFRPCDVDDLLGRAS